MPPRMPPVTPLKPQVMPLMPQLMPRAMLPTQLLLPVTLLLKSRPMQWMLALLLLVTLLTVQLMLLTPPLKLSKPSPTKTGPKVRSVLD